MKKIVDLIPHDLPRIYAGNWASEHAKGWRWVLNLHIHEEDSAETVEEYQTAHGVRNVTVGHAFDLDTRHPEPQPLWCGLYVKDVEDLVSSLRRGMDDLGALGRWLRGEDEHERGEN